jgi:hypothetical protein
MRILSDVVEPPITNDCGDGLNGGLNSFYILKLSIYRNRRIIKGDAIHKL